MIDKQFIPLENYNYIEPEEILERVKKYFEMMKKRRTVRDFDSKQIPMEIIEECIKTAGTAPSGANLQPWHFVVITNPKIKKQIRMAAEEEEKLFYEERASDEWLDALKPLGTDSVKAFLEKAPVLIAIFEKKYLLEGENKSKVYYSKESVGLATGFLISAIHNCGLVSLTHTPSPMNFLNNILNRPQNEKPFLLLVVGYPKRDAEVPNIRKKPLNEIASFLE